MNRGVVDGTTAANVRLLRCSQCSTGPGVPCQRDPRADHLARWLDSFRAGHITRAHLVAAIGGMVVLAGSEFVAERAA